MTSLRVAAACAVVLMLAEIAGASPITSAAAVPVDVQPLLAPVALPAWRQSLAVGQFSAIPGTAGMNGTTTNSATIDAWNGLATGPTQWWSLANGGHEDSSENKVIVIDLADDAPVWRVINAGSPATDVPPKINLLYYYDGLPASSHSYYTSQYIGARQRVMRFSTGVVWGNGNGGGPNVDAFRLLDNQWDPAGTWPGVPIALPSVVSTVAKDPVTEDVYVGNNGGFAKWTQSSDTWSAFRTIPEDVQWQFHGSMIDPLRNRWVYAGGPKSLGLIDLTTHAYSSLALTGIEGDAPFGSYDAIIHDLDNDRYLLQTDSRVYAIDPNSGATSQIASVVASPTGPLGRFAYFPALGGVAYLPSYASNILFMPTRSGAVAQVAAQAGVLIAVEYYHTGFGHYFITASRDEIAALDAGVFPQWERTGQSFKVYPLDAPGMANVCRFFSAKFAPKSSHFYTPSATECALTKNNPDWVFEGEVFSVSPVATSGACAAGNTPLYRLYNNGIGGAPNHRYTTSLSIRSTMQSEGWIPEGFGSDGVTGCVPK